MRLGLIKDNIELPLQDGFLLCDETGTEQVRLLALISRGGSCLAYRGVRSRNGRNVACIVKEFFPKEAYEDGIYIRGQSKSYQSYYTPSESERLP